MSEEKDFSWLVPEGFVPPIEIDSRICFSIAWFDSEEAADAYAEVVRKEGRTYNGGWYHGMACGRDKSWDRKKTEPHKFAVTF